MSFRFSVGDFVAVTKLIAGICSCLRSSSTLGHNELLVELPIPSARQYKHRECTLSSLGSYAVVARGEVSRGWRDT